MSGNLRMLINGTDVKNSIMSSILVSVGVSLMFIISIVYMYDGVVNDYKNRLKSVAYTEGIDISLMCNIVSCKYATVNIHGDTKTYVNNNSILEPAKIAVSDKPHFYFKHITDDGLTNVIYTDGVTKIIYTFYIDDYIYYDMAYAIIRNIFLVLTIMLFIGFINIASKRNKLAAQDVKTFKDTTRAEFRHNLMESLNHELRLPVEIVKALLREMFIMLYPCQYTETGICEYQDDTPVTESCSGCKYAHSKRAVDKIAIDYYHKMLSQTDRIDAIMNILADGKEIKYSNGTVSIHAILQNVMSTLNTFTYPKLGCTFINDDLFLNYATGGTLHNGDTQGLFNIMINNSIEAKASNMTFKAEKVENGFLTMYITDDGRGIRDLLDKISKDDKVFMYGYSNKDIYGNGLRAVGFLERIIVRWNLVEEGNSPRGVGLSHNKGLLSATGGGIFIHDTSPSGTTFKIVLPVKEKRNGEKTTKL